MAMLWEKPSATLGTLTTSSLGFQGQLALTLGAVFLHFNCSTFFYILVIRFHALSFDLSL